MSAAIESQRPVARASDAHAGVAPFAAAAATFVLGTAAAAVAAPVALSVVAVFVFAGPHNWIEARYFLARLPGRWGRSRPFFALAIGGAVAMTALYFAMGQVARVLDVGDAGAGILVATWATAAVAWLVAVTAAVGRQLGRDWTWAVPVGLFVVAFAWVAPGLWWIGLVYGHPLVALVFLDRELRRRPALRRVVRGVAAAIPVLVAAIWMAAPPGPELGGSPLVMRIADHAGATILPAINARLLVGTHAFLETVHYGAWVIAMPLVGFRRAPWHISAVPIAQRSAAARIGVAVFLLTGVAAVAVLWTGFVLDYERTRDIYFTLAMLHVLVEAPFLVRLLAPRGSARDA